MDTQSIDNKMINKSQWPFIIQEVRLKKIVTIPGIRLILDGVEWPEEGHL